MFKVQSVIFSLLRKCPIILRNSTVVFFSRLLSNDFSQSEDGVYIHTRSDENLFNLTFLRAKTQS